MYFDSLCRRITPQSYADSTFESYYGGKGYVVIGIDEVGRGALAGPIGVGAVAMKTVRNGEDAKVLTGLGLKDSKLLTHSQRVRLSADIEDHSLASAVVFGEISDINRFGIVYAFEKAVRTAVYKVRESLKSDLPTFLLIDAFKVPYVKGVGQKRQLNIIKGDMRCVSIAAASILAKVARDNLMCVLSKKHGAYKWESNKGYGTRDHIEALRSYGTTIHHRPLFLRRILS